MSVPKEQKQGKHTRCSPLMLCPIPNVVRVGTYRIGYGYFPEVRCFVTHFPKEHCLPTWDCPFIPLLLILILLQFFGSGIAARHDLVSLADCAISLLFAMLFKETLACVLLQTW